MIRHLSVLGYGTLHRLWQGRKLEGKVLVDSGSGAKPFTFNIGLGQVIKGWDQGVMTMKVGEIARLTCPTEYAYGSTGFPAWGIIPNSPLIFEIELLSIR